MREPLPVRTPYDGRAMLEYWGRDPQDAVDVVLDGAYLRVVELGANRAALALRPAEREIRIEVAAWARRSTARDRAAVRSVAAHMAGADLDLAAFARAVSGDPVMSALERRFRGVKVPQTPQPFDALLWAILGQQISTVFAHALKRRISTTFAEPIVVRGRPRYSLPTPQRLATLDLEALCAIGTTRAKSRAIVEAARAAASGGLDFAELAGLETEGVIERLCRLRGVGRWTAEYVAMRGLARTDSLPAADVALQRAAGIAYGTRFAGVEGLRRLGKRWRGWESYGTFYLWRSLSKPAG
ncbi:MAG: DNA-3-methyladenine glycosylase 2 family protein [bacterium]|nr:DNA-3-methyladenine glycosylase 2 family protein [bacterium]